MPLQVLWELLIYRLHVMACMPRSCLWALGLPLPPSLIFNAVMLLPAVQQWYNQSSLVEFYQDQNIRAGVKSYMGKIIMRNNTITGRLYRDEPAILAWDIMNEPQFPGDDTGKLLTVSFPWLQYTICAKSAVKTHIPDTVPAAFTRLVYFVACPCRFTPYMSLLGLAGAFCALWAAWAPSGPPHTA